MIAGGLLKALLGVIQRSLASLSRAATAVYLPLTGWWGFAIKKNICFENSFFHEIILIYNLDYDILMQLEREHRIIGRNSMPVCYDKLWKILIDKKMNRTDLKDMAGISFNVLAKLGRGEFVSMESLYRICKALNCNIGDIVEFEKEMKNR